MMGSYTSDRSLSECKVAFDVSVELLLSEASPLWSSVRILLLAPKCYKPTRFNVATPSSSRKGFQCSRLLLRQYLLYFFTFHANKQCTQQWHVGVLLLKVWGWIYAMVDRRCWISNLQTTFNFGTKYHFVGTELDKVLENLAAVGLHLNVEKQRF